MSFLVLDHLASTADGEWVDAQDLHTAQPMVNLTARLSVCDIIVKVKDVSSDDHMEMNNNEDYLEKLEAFQAYVTLSQKLQDKYAHQVEEYISRFIDKWMAGGICQAEKRASENEVPRADCHHASYFRFPGWGIFLWHGFKTQNPKDYESDIDPFTYETTDIKTAGVIIGIYIEVAGIDNSKQRFGVSVDDAKDNVFGLGVRYHQDFATFEELAAFLEVLLLKF